MKTLLRAPGVYDGLSALVAARYSFEALYVTGYGISASLGLPDAGLVTYTEMVHRIQVISDVTDIPLVCDADTGFGGVANIRRTVRGYERAGASAIQIEDQESPKKCGHTDGRLVVPIAEMEVRIKVALDSRRSEETLIIARTDSRTTRGLDEAIERANRYHEAGADLIFVESPESEEEMRNIARSVPAPLIANMVVQGKTPLIPAPLLKDMGFAMAIYPSISFRSVAGVLDSVYKYLHHDQDAVNFPVKFFGQDEKAGAMHRLVQFPAVWDLESRFKI